MKSSVTFTVFADFHYKKGMYVSGVADMEEIFRRAKKDGAELVIHLGDMCNDYRGSPELVSAYLDNSEGLDVFGTFGNHELETAGNTMRYVTEKLTNTPKKAVFGTPDGTLGDGSTAYYYTDRDNFRFIFLDTNYSVNPETDEYEHNKNASWGAPSGNTRIDSLGDEQLLWLESLLLRSAAEEKICIVLSHSSFCGEWKSSPDAERVRELFTKANLARRGTVALAMNGHLHTNHSAVVDDVAYLDINTVRCGLWRAAKFHPYAEENPEDPKFTYEFTDYDENGNPTRTYQRPLSTLKMGAQTLFFANPLCATVTVTANAGVTVCGSKTEWMYGIAPESEGGTPPLTLISDFKKA